MTQINDSGNNMVDLRIWFAFALKLSMFFFNLLVVTQINNFIIYNDKALK